MFNSLSPAVAESEEICGEVSRRRVFLLAALVLLTIGAGFRLYHLGERSLWYDEAVTANISRGIFTQVLAETQRVSAPVIHPYILYLAEKAGRGPVAVRMPSLLSSLLVVVMMLAMVCAKISRSAALFSAAFFSVSASQIRYAQEVREYSLTVLCATILVFCLLKWEATGSRSDHPLSLYAVLFIAPLIQYGLVLLAFAILGTIVLRLLLTHDTRFTLSHLLTASTIAAAGAVLTYFLTLHYQIQPGKVPWYIAGNYFDPKSVSLLKFLGKNSWELVTFIFPARVADLCFALAGAAYCTAQVITRKFSTVTLLLVTSVLTAVCASLTRFYPYGGIRQCLFLAPVLALFAGVAFADVLQWIRGPVRSIATAALMAIIVVSLIRGTFKQWPYGEIEDTQSLLRELARSSRPTDQVWVNHDAVAAFEFYLPEKDPRFTYGTFHENAKDYIPELSAAIDPHTNRLWLVFSHLSQASDRAEEQLILSSLQSSWDAHLAVSATNAELYAAHRRTSQ